jgi:DNA-binding XRE family transcriptional regulator
MSKQRRETPREAALNGQWAALRRLSGYSHEEVARFLGHEKASAYRRIEKGEREPKLSTVVRLAALFNCQLRHICPDFNWSERERATAFAKRKTMLLPAIN